MHFYCIETMVLTLYDAHHLFIVRHLHCFSITVSLLLLGTVFSHTQNSHQIWTWDAIISLSNEIEVFADRDIRMVDVVYALSRYDPSRRKCPPCLYHA